MPLPLIPLALGGLTLLALKKKPQGGSAPQPDTLGLTKAGAGGPGLVLSGAQGAAQAVGQGIDRLLGGSGNGATGIIAQGATVGAVSTVVVGAAIGAAFPALGITLGLLAMLSVGVLVVGALVYAVATVWSDLERLAYGQAGAQRDFEKERANLLQNAVSALKTKFTAAEAQVYRMAIPYVDGIMWERNRIAFNAWMKRPHGIGIDNITHARFGADRGYFYGMPQAEYGTGNVSFGQVDPSYRTADSDYIHNYAATPILLPDGNVIPAVAVKVSTQTVKVTTRAASKTLLYRGPVDLRAKTFDQTSTIVSIGPDGVGDQAFATGKQHANVAAYLRHMLDAKGLGQSENSHAAYGLRNGFFEGDLDGSTLLYAGQRFAWRDFQ